MFGNTIVNMILFAMALGFVAIIWMTAFCVIKTKEIITRGSRRVFK